MDSGGPKEACIRWDWTLVPPGKYDWTVHVRRRCGLMWNYFDHWFQKHVICFSNSLTWNDINVRVYSHTSDHVDHNPSGHSLTTFASSSFPLSHVHFPLPNYMFFVDIQSCWDKIFSIRNTTSGSNMNYHTCSTCNHSNALYLPYHRWWLLVRADGKLTWTQHVSMSLLNATQIRQSGNLNTSVLMQKVLQDCLVSLSPPVEHLALRQCHPRLSETADFT